MPRDGKKSGKSREDHRGGKKREDFKGGKKHEDHRGGKPHSGGGHRAESERPRKDVAPKGRPHATPTNLESPASSTRKRVLAARIDGTLKLGRVMPDKRSPERDRKPKGAEETAERPTEMKRRGPRNAGKRSRSPMRVDSGSHRGTRLAVPEGKDIRPTSDRARQAIFNILAHGHDAIDGCEGAGCLCRFRRAGA